MIQTDKHYHNPVVYKVISSLDNHIQLDTVIHAGDLGLVYDSLGYVSGTFMKPVSFVSNDAAVYPN